MKLFKRITKPPREQQFVAELPQSDTELRFDQNSPTWRFIKNHIENRLQYLREYNDSPRHDENKTSVTRGRIQELKDLLDLPKSTEKENAHD